MEVYVPRVRAEFPIHATLCSGITLVSPLRDYHPLWCRVPADFTLRRSGGPGPHISMRSPARIRLALFRFRSPLLTESRLISFPLPTKMLQFGRFPLAKRVALRPGGPIRQSLVQRLLAPTQSNIAAWHDLPRLPSRAIPHLACSNTLKSSISRSIIDFDGLLSPGCVCTPMQRCMDHRHRRPGGPYGPTRRPPPSRSGCLGVPVDIPGGRRRMIVQRTFCEVQAPPLRESGLVGI